MTLFNNDEDVSSATNTTRRSTCPKSGTVRKAKYHS